MREKFDRIQSCPGHPPQSMKLHRDKAAIVWVRGRVGLLFGAVLIAMVAPLSKSIPSLDDKRTSLRSIIPMGPQETRIKDTCIVFSASMVSKSFEGLQRIETASGVQFARSRKPITNFPEYIDVELWAKPYPCAKEPSRPQSTELETEVFDSLILELSWKHQMEVQKATVISSVRKRFLRRWLFLVQVRSADIPLTDHLILSVLTGDGARVARLSGQL
jgi:hypothetical protein